MVVHFLLVRTTAVMVSGRIDIILFIIKPAPNNVQIAICECNVIETMAQVDQTELESCGAFHTSAIQKEK